MTIAKIKKARPELPQSLLDGLQTSSFPISHDDFLAVLELLGEEPEVIADVVSGSPGSVDALAELEKRYIGAVPEVRERISRGIERGPVGDAVKKANGYRCLVCEATGENPIGFLKPNGEPYVEAYHVMPVAKRHIGSLAASNVITVCAKHHRHLHYGVVEIEVRENSFDLRMPDGAISILRHAFPRL